MPVRYGYKRVFVKGYVDKVVIAYQDTVIATHKRCYTKGDTFYDPLHYLPLLERKVGALEQAAPLKGWSLPSVFEKHALLEKKDGQEGAKRLCENLLLETYGLDEVTTGLKKGLSLGVVSKDGLKHLILAEIEQRPARLDLLNFPQIPTVCVDQTPLKSYDRLAKETAL